MEESTYEPQLPGFRFNPTEEELLGFYLKNTIFGKKFHSDIIGFLNIYQYDPWDLPGLAKIGEREWYFFVPRERKHGSRGRPNRITGTGFWKAMGSDRKIRSISDPKRMLGLKKTLVFHKGRAPRGSKTDWVMNEYRLPDTCDVPKNIVLCKIHRKATSLKVLEERAAMDLQEMKTIHALQPSQQIDTTSFCTRHEDQYLAAPMATQHVAFKKEEEVDDLVTGQEIKYETAEEVKGTSTNTSFLLPCKKEKLLPCKKEKLPELQVPMFNMDWTQDPFWTQLQSPWLDSWMTQDPFWTQLQSPWLDSLMTP